MIATYHSDRGEKSALLMVQRSKFAFGKTPVYVPRTAVADLKPGDEIELPDDLEIVPIVDFETGDVRTAKDGSPLKQFA